MSQVTIKLIKSELMSEFYFSKKGPVELAKELIANGSYVSAGEFFCHERGEAAAEEMFDLTNNPGRQGDRMKFYGRGRSISVGDIVEVDGVPFLCASLGWTAIA